MDLEHLIHREDEERRRAAEATNDAAREAHVALADLYRERIADARGAVRAADGRATQLSAA